MLCYSDAQKLAYIEWRVAILKVTLTDTNNYLNCHLVKTHPLLGMHPMTETATKNTNTLESPIQSLLAILSPGCKRFELG